MSREHYRETDGQSNSKLKALAKGVAPEFMLEWWRLRHYRRDIRLDPQQYREALVASYTRHFGVAPNLDDPQRLTEKIHWLKLWDSTEEKGRPTDKWSVRPLVATEIGSEHLVPLVVEESWDDVDNIPIGSLPECCVLKLTTGSGFNLFVTQGSKPNRRDIKKFFNGPMQRDYAFVNGGFELHYSFIKPAIIAEEYMASESNLVDYRFWCSWGRVFSIWVDTGSWNHDYHRTVFDEDWNLIDVCATHPRHDTPPDMPSTLDEMKQCAGVLSRNFSLVRVDFYEHEGVAIFGEMTFTPQSGFMTFDDLQFDYWMGSQIVLPEEKKPFRGVML